MTGKPLAVALCLLALPAIAVAAPWDGPRAAATVGGDVPLFPVPGAVTITWEPGVEDVTTDAARRARGPAVLEAAGLRLDRVGPVGAPRMHTEEYRLPEGADPRAVARALGLRADVRVAAPLFRLQDAPLAAWRAATSDVLVMLADPADRDLLQASADALDLDLVAARPGFPGQWRLRLRAGARVDPVEASMRLREQPWVRWSQADWIQERSERYTPADDRFETQWHLNNTGQSGGAPGNDVNAPEAWDLTRGAPDVIVGILDSGVQLDHPDLVGSLLPGYDFVDNDDDPSPNGSHGTSVAGVAAAPENGVGVVGVCPLCSILPVRVIGASDSGEADAHVFAADQGAWVINNSWGPPDNTGAEVPMGPAMESALAYVLSTGRGGLGTVVFWAAGNGHPTDTCSDDGFAAHPDVIAVGASTNAGVRSGYSEICPELDLSAPSNGGSSGIVSTRTGGGFTTSFGGTSAASPVAAGAGAVVLAALPELSAGQLQDLLESTATRIDEIGGAWDQSGHSNHYGWGRVDAAAALQSELAFLSVPVGLTHCEDTVDVEVSLPRDPGLGRVTVTASSQTEPGGETVELTEGDPGVYSGSVALTRAAAQGGDGLVSASDGDTLTVASPDSGTSRSVALDCSVPALSSVTVDNVTWGSARVQWVTDELADGRAFYGDAQDAFDPTLTLAHQLQLIDLDECTAYRVTLESADELGNRGRLNNAATFTTLGDVSVLPDDAPEDADPCDPDTWTEGGPEPTPAPTPTLVNGDGNTCSGCSAAEAPAGVGWLGLLGVGLVVRRRRR